MSSVGLGEAEAPLVLALDVGTSSCRAALYDARARRVAELGPQRTYTPRTTADGGAELDADALVALVALTIDELVEQARGRLDSIGAVATCTFWHSLLGVDAEGRAVTPVYLWLDARSRDAAEALKRQLDERAVHARTGCVLHWSYWPAKLVWLSRTRPELFAAARRWISFGEYLLERLHGERGVSVSMASGTGLLNQHRCDWDDELLEALPIDRTRLAPVRESRVPSPTKSRVPSPESRAIRHSGLGRGALLEPHGDSGLGTDFRGRWPVLERVPWLPAVGDGAASNLGAGCTTRERMALMIGTSGAMRALWRADEVTIPWGAWCYRADRQRVVMGGAINDGGSLLGWLRSTLQLPPLEQVEREVARLEPTAHGLTLLPLWGGERSPRWAADGRGAIVGLRLHTSPLEIWRAALEAVAMTFGELAAIVRLAVPEAREVIATGGALLHSPAWLQIMADVLEQPVAISTEPEASSRGAALLALEQLGALPDRLEMLSPAIERVYEPVPAHAARYQEAAARQRQLYDVLIGGQESGVRSQG